MGYKICIYPNNPSIIAVFINEYINHYYINLMKSSNSKIFCVDVRVLIELFIKNFPIKYAVTGYG